MSETYNKWSDSDTQSFVLFAHSSQEACESACDKPQSLNWPYALMQKTSNKPIKFGFHRKGRLFACYSFSFPIKEIPWATDELI